MIRSRWILLVIVLSFLLLYIQNAWIQTPWHSNDRNDVLKRLTVESELKERGIYRFFFPDEFVDEFVNYDRIAGGGAVAKAILVSNITTVQVIPENITSQLGESFSTYLNVNLKVPTSGMQTNVHWNKSVLYLNHVSQGDLFTNRSWNKTNQTFWSKGVVNNSRGKVSNIFEVILGRTNTTSPGILAIMNFTVIGRGSSEIGLGHVILSTPNGKSIPFVSANGSLSGGQTYQDEDVNQDGKIDLLDILIVATYFGQENTIKGDINKDGIVDIIDLSRVAYYLR